LNVPVMQNLPPGDYLRLEVSDTGCGMTPEMRRKAFDPFFTTKSAGRGMGLAVVQRVVRGLGGSIHVVSSVGCGTAVQIALPCAAEVPGALEIRGSSGGQSREKQPQAGNCVLVVEDEALLLSAVSKMLQHKGFSVIQASSGSSALEVIRECKDSIHAMLLDVTLPGASSREVLEEAQRLRPDVVAILTSAYGREKATASFAGLTVEHFIRKPFQVDDLVTLLQHTLSVRSSTGANHAAEKCVSGPLTA
jgi:CheY-like chemotaxis protein